MQCAPVWKACPNRDAAGRRPCAPTESDSDSALSPETRFETLAEASARLAEAQDKTGVLRTLPRITRTAPSPEQARKGQASSGAPWEYFGAGRCAVTRCLQVLQAPMQQQAHPAPPQEATQEKKRGTNSNRNISAQPLARLVAMLDKKNLAVCRTAAPRSPAAPPRDAPGAQRTALEPVGARRARKCRSAAEEIIIIPP